MNTHLQKIARLITRPTAYSFAVFSVLTFLSSLMWSKVISEPFNIALQTLVTLVTGLLCMITGFMLGTLLYNYLHSKKQ